jgi:hypothetical protein
VFGRFLPHRKGFVEGRRQQTIFSERKEAGDQEQAQGCIAVSGSRGSTVIRTQNDKSQFYCHIFQKKQK